MNTIHKGMRAPVRPTQVERRCTLADTHGASCSLPRGHAGPCFVVPLDCFAAVTEGEFEQMTRRWT